MRRSDRCLPRKGRLTCSPHKRFLVEAVTNVTKILCRCRRLRRTDCDAPIHRHKFCARQSEPAISEHLTEVVAHCVMQAARLGSILKYCALHSAMHELCLSLQSDAPMQAVQLAAACAATTRGAIHPTSARMIMAAFTIASRFSSWSLRRVQVDRFNNAVCRRSCEADYGLI